MKKNKKYWKKEYKALSKLHYDLEDSLDQYAISNIILQDQLDRLENELDKLKNLKSATTTVGTGKTTGTNTNYQVWSNANPIEKWAKDFMQKHNIPVGVDEATKRVIAESETLGKECNCKCNCNK